jgi:group I intron endonuclease
MNDVAHLYRLTSPSGKAYFGIAKNPRKRWQEHLCAANAGSRCALHKAIRKHTFEAFRKEVLVTASLAYVKALERRAIAAYGTLAPVGYNLTEGGDGTHGYAHREETKRKISSAQKGRPLSSSHKEKLSVAQTGKTLSAEHKRKIGVASAALERPASWGQAISAALRGKKRSEEQRAARAENQRRLWADPEYRAKMMAARAARRG